MKKIFYFFFIMLSFSVWGQSIDSLNNYYSNSVEKMLRNKPGLLIGGYGEVHYNQPLNGGVRQQGILDVHRTVLFVGYNFSSKTQFISEIEIEYAREVWLEQMFLQHSLNKYINLRAGLLLVPMGIINEYHEPTFFNGVERPVLDNRMALSTWREVGAGFSGNILPASLKYQLYVVGGLNGYDNGGIFSGSKALREGRQKGSKAYLTSPALTGKMEYYGLGNLNIGLSAYLGKSQSRLYNNLKDNDFDGISRADSSVVNISMLGIDFRYRLQGLKLQGQLYYTLVGNSQQYNVFTAKNGKFNDLGHAMLGYYTEAGYNINNLLKLNNNEWVLFVRYEFVDTHHAVDDNIIQNIAYAEKLLTFGMSYYLTKGAVLKGDIVLNKKGNETSYSKTLNLGFGINF